MINMRFGDGLEMSNAWLQDQVKNLGFDKVGWTPLKRPLSMDVYIQWIADGLHGEMDYLAKHLACKENPQTQWPELNSSFVFAKLYHPHPHPLVTPCSGLTVARYARGEDYHYWFKKELAQVVTRMQNQYPKEVYVPMADSGPVLERDLAYRAGLGWVGKNTCLIDSKIGSYFFIGEIYTSLFAPDEVTQPHPNRCGTCRRCIDACPTGALSEAGGLDARKCISYWNIESQSIPPDDIQKNIGKQFFGCDICQEVCPWNKKAIRDHKKLIKDKPLASIDVNQSQSTSIGDQNDLISSLKWILNSSGKKIAKTLSGNPLLRARPFGLKRNALVVIKNLRIRELRPEVESLTENNRLGELAKNVLAVLPLN